MRPDPENYNPSPEYIRALVDKAGISRREASRLVRMTWPGFRNYLRDVDHKLYRVAPYTVQFALECLAHESGESK